MKAKTIIEFKDSMIPSGLGEGKKKKVAYRKIAELSSLGLMLPSSIAVGLFFGYLLDKLLGTHPWLLLVFMILGTISGFISLLRGLAKYKNE
jgi:F0F1-type ATP synthase assembly protein I